MYGASRFYIKPSNLGGYILRILDLDMDYFMDSVATFVPESAEQRLDEDDYSKTVWDSERVRTFLECNLGLSMDAKINGRIVSGHNEALHFWKDLINAGKLNVPFEVIHVDSHADLGLGYDSWTFIMQTLLAHPVQDRPKNSVYKNCFGRIGADGIGDYLLFAIAYRWISNIIYCANPNGDKNDYLLSTMKNFEEEYIFEKPVHNIIELLFNPDECPNHNATTVQKREFIIDSIKEPEVPLTIIPTIDGVKFDGNFDYVVLAQSPNYTPASADFIMDIFREYIIEC